MEKKNIILLDSAPQEEWNFKELLEKYTGIKWEIWHIDSHFSDSGIRKKMKFFLFPLKILKWRNKLEIILSYQQFYGLIFSVYCEILHLAKKNALVIMTFIYRPKKGMIGKLYFRFMKYAVNSEMIDKIICYSNTEPRYYETLFGTKPGKFVYIPLGIGDLGRYTQKMVFDKEKRFILSVGKSNRDYDFLVESLVNTSYKVRILSDIYKCKELGNNIQLYSNVFGEDYYKMLSECYCVIVPLQDIHISSGQLVFLQAMMFGKPIIVTESDTVGDYIQNGRNGFIISKDKEKLLEKLSQLYQDSDLYQKISEEERCIFLQKFSLESMAKAAGEILDQLGKNDC